MTRHREYPKVWILNAEKNDSEHFLVVNFEFENNDINIRFGIDERTYKGIKRVIQERYFEKTLISEYKFHLLLGYRHWKETKMRKFLFFFKKKYEVDCQSGYIEVWYHKNHKDVDFDCSHLFISNIEWLRTIKSIDELKHLEIELN